MSELNIGKVIIDQTKTSQVVVNYADTSKPDTSTITSNRSQMTATVDNITTAFNASTTYYYDENGGLSTSNEGYGIAGFTDADGIITIANVFINISTANERQFVRTLEDDVINEFWGTCHELVTEIKIYGIKADTSEILLATTTPFFSEGVWRFQENLEFSEDDFSQNENITVKAVSEEWIVSDDISAMVRDISILVPESTVTTSASYSCIGYTNLSDVDTITVSVYKRISEYPLIFAWVDIGTLTVLNRLVTGDIDCSSLTIGNHYNFKFVCGTAESQYSYMVVGS
ncbi:hypothetical protein [Sulfurimonas sp.]|uniref:hypothetical protein n=1 Tax=Sulfurimonas sp. TaxID=2022749 RepID=UPI0025E86416|nr:hypothetical protein [Sulfurimonas sp.]MCK9473734.1 hypothetical protein [Sulfurimonas sp.]